METIRELKELDIDVYFEEQNIHTISPDGELMMTILAAYAQEESRSVSENQKWRVKRQFEDGKPWDGTLLGYRYSDGKYVIHPEEAEVVREMFRLYIDGNGFTNIARILNEKRVPSPSGTDFWRASAVNGIIGNEKMRGNILCQIKYVEDYLMLYNKT